MRDASGAVVGGARVAVVSTARVDATESGTDGAYRLQVPAGMPFELRASREGFADAVVTMPGVSEAGEP